MKSLCWYPDLPFRITGLCSAYDREWDSEFDFLGESHDFWEIVAVISGEVEIVEEGRVYQLGGGQMILHRPNEFHRIKSAGGTKPHTLVLSFENEGELPASLGSGVFDLTDEFFEEYNYLFSLVFPYVAQMESGREASDEDTVNARIGIFRLEAFLLALSRNEGSNERLSSTVSASEYRELVRTMRKHVNDNLTLPELSKLRHISESYIKKLFRLYAGEGAMTYYNRLRMREAENLLSKGHTAAEIAEKMNFSSTAYFSYYFKKHTGMNVREYRNSGALTQGESVL